MDSVFYALVWFCFRIPRNMYMNFVVKKYKIDLLDRAGIFQRDSNKY